MDSKGVEMGLVLALLMVVMWGENTMAQSGCTTAVLGMSPCLNYISGNTSTPSSSCCSQLGKVVQSQPECLCMVLSGGSAALGYTLNQTQAVMLPGACNLQTPPISQCTTGNGPTTSTDTPTSSPVGSPTDSSDETPEIPDTPSAGGGSKTFPSTDGTSAGGSNIKVSFNLVFFALVVASCIASTATRF